MAEISDRDARNLVETAVALARGDGNESALRYLEQAAKTLKPLKARTATGRTIDARPFDRTCPTCEAEHRLAVSTAFLFAAGQLGLEPTTPVLMVDCECGETLMIRAEEMGI